MIRAFFKSIANPLLLLSLSISFSLFLFQSSLLAESQYTDLTQNPFYDDSIHYFTAQHFIQGDTNLEGIPKGTFRPNDLINRAEFAKITSTFTLAEGYGKSEGWKEMDAGELVNHILKKLKPYFNCNSGACSSIGNNPFTDVPEREFKICDTSADNACQPWYSPYIYHAVSIGRVKGYLENNQRLYKPEQNILRIHALKMMLVDNGNIAPQQDGRFQALTLLAYEHPTQGKDCLAEAQSFILNNNQNDDPKTKVEAQWLLDYALLANDLGFFGQNCEAMNDYGAYTPQARANFLQEPITRKEVMRYFGLSTRYEAPEPEMTWEEYEQVLEEEEKNQEAQQDPEELLSEELIESEELDEGEWAEDEFQKTIDQEAQDWLAKQSTTEQDQAKALWESTRGEVIFINQTLKFFDKEGFPYYFPANSPLKITEDGNGYAQVVVEGYSVPYTIDCIYLECGSVGEVDGTGGPQKESGRMVQNADLLPLEISYSTLVPSESIVKKGASVLKGNSYTVTPNKSTIWICTDIRPSADMRVEQKKNNINTQDHSFASSSSACKAVSGGTNLKTKGGVLVARTSSDGKTKLWQKVIYNGQTYYALLRDLDYKNTPADLENYIKLRLELERGISASEKLGNITSYDSVPDTPNWAEPIHVLTGNFWSEKVDLQVPSGGKVIPIKRVYNSQSLVEGPLGMGWSFEYNVNLKRNAFEEIEMTFGDGHKLFFSEDENGVFRPNNMDGDFFLKEDYFYYRPKNGQEYEFDSTGQLVSLKNRSGKGLYFSRNKRGLIEGIKDDTDTLFVLEYNSQNHIKKITDLSGRKVSYSYKNNDLVKVCGPKFWSCYKYSYDDDHRLITIKNEKNRVMIKNEYDDQSRVIRQTDVTGAVVSLEYSEGKTVMTDALGQSKTHYYNDSFMTTKEQDELGSEKAFAYDDFGRLDQLVDAQGNAMTYEYDEMGNKVGITQATGEVSRITYNDQHQPTSLTDALGNTTYMEYDTRGNLIKSTDALGATTLYTYDKFSQKLSETNPKGAITQWEYNPDGTTKSMTDPLGNKTTYTYNQARLLESTNDALGNKTEFDYDKNHQLTQTITSGVKTTRVQYDRLGNKVYQKDANGNKAKFFYDKKNRLITQINPAGEKIENVYDANDNLIKVISKSGSIQYRYNQGNQLISVINALGNEIHYEYDEKGNKTKTVDAEGAETSFAYDEKNQLLKTTDAEGGVTEFFYDSRGNLIKTINAEGGIKTAEFDSLNRLSKSVDEMGYVTTYEYDAVGNEIKITDPNGGVLQFKYDLNNQLIAETDAEGNTSKYTYDALGRQVESIDPLGNKTTFIYDAWGRLIEQKNALGLSTRFEYDKVGNRLASVDANGNRATFQYDQLNRLVKTADLMGNVSRSTYDGSGNLVEVKNARGGTYHYEYDSLGRMTQSMAPNGLTSSFTYDATDRQIKIMAEGRTSDFEYNQLGQLVSQKNTLGQATHYEYDRLGRQVKVIDTAGNTTQYTYNALGQNTLVKNALGNTKSSEYDALGNVLSKTDFNGSRAEFKYDKNNRLTHLTDAGGNTIRYQYNGAGQQVTLEDPMGSIIKNRFDALGRLVETRNAHHAGTRFAYDEVGNKIMEEKFEDKKTAQKMTYTYDALSRITSVTDSLGGVVHYQYDEASNRTEVMDQNGHATKTVFDEMNHPIKTTDPLGYFERWNYDLLGNVIGYTDKNGSTETREYDELDRLINRQKADEEITQTYDTLGNMTSIEDEGGIISLHYNALGFLESVIDQKAQGAYFKYDPAGNLIKKSDLTGITEYDYQNNQVVGITLKPNEGKTIRFNYQYTPLGQVSQMTYPNQSSTDYGYDDLGRLTSIKTGDKLRMEYTYNGFDLRTGLQTKTGEEISQEEFDYDSAGRLIKWTKDGIPQAYEYDPAYNRIAVITGDEKEEYDYNEMNQLVSDGEIENTYDKNGFLLSNGRSNYSWDALGRLEKFTAPDGNEVAYTYDALNRMIQRNATEFVYTGLANQFALKVADGVETAYFYDMNGNPLANHQSGALNAYLKNAHNDVVAHLNESGNVIEPIVYSVFGESEVSEGGRLAFQGQYQDEDSGLSHLNSRLYDPKTAQFLSPDPFPGKTEAPASLNKYAYAHNDPVNFWDQSGLYDMAVHYYKTKDWAYAAAIGKGFSTEMARQLALNIASFDQYHDKEWELAPNNYAGGNGQGNNIHFMNPERDQMAFSEFDNQYIAPGSSPTMRLTNEFRDNDYIDPLSKKVAYATTVPIYTMKSLSEFNNEKGASDLVTDPTVIRVSEDKGGKIDSVTLAAGTLKERLNYAIKQHDPRLFGVAMHEYQDHFAHAGFEKWHGTSHDNDYYCETRSSSEANYCNIDGLYRDLDMLRQFNQSANTLDINLILGKARTREALYQRDKLMREGTQYWMEKFMQSQAEYYQENLSQTIMYNKEEKMLHNANQVLKVEEEFDSPQYKDALGGNFGVFTKQSTGIGGAPCTEIVKNAYQKATGEGEVTKNNYSLCRVYYEDFEKRIIR